MEAVCWVACREKLVKIAKEDIKDVELKERLISMGKPSAGKWIGIPTAATTVLNANPLLGLVIGGSMYGARKSKYRIGRLLAGKEKQLPEDQRLKARGEIRRILKQSPGRLYGTLIPTLGGAGAIGGAVAAGRKGALIGGLGGGALGAALAALLWPGHRRLQRVVTPAAKRYRIKAE